MGVFGLELARELMNQRLQFRHALLKILDILTFRIGKVPMLQHSVLIRAAAYHARAWVGLVVFVVSRSWLLDGRLGYLEIRGEGLYCRLKGLRASFKFLP